VSSNHFAKSIGEIGRTDPAKALELIVDHFEAIIDQPLLPPDHPDAAALQEEKRRAQTTLLHWNAHYGPGGPYEGLGPKDDESRGGAGGS
jgi:hypothetical protein